MRKIFIFIFSLCACGSNAQDIHFSQVSETPLLINPALTGAYNGFYRGILNYRNQWPAMEKAFNTMMGSFDMPLEVKAHEGAYIGTGIYFFSDKAGDSHFGTTQVKFSVSALLPVNPTSKFSAGLQMGLAQHSVNLADIQWPDQYNGQNYDPTLPSNEQTGKNAFAFFDMGVGVNYETDKSKSTLFGQDAFKFNAGASFSHASMPLQKFYNSSVERQYAKLALHSSLLYDFPGTVWGIVPSFLYLMQGPAREFYIGSLVRYKINQGTKVTDFYTESAFSAGLFYRFRDAISPQVYFEFSDYGIGLSYDFNASSYREVKRSAGGFEISFKYANMKGAARKGNGKKGATRSE